VEAHLYSALMAQEVPMPAMGVVISGGHTALVKIESIGCYTLIGKTQDDAIGESFDKVARLLQLPYPGGPEIERLAKNGNPHRYRFKSGQLKGRPFDFSFSGLKTAILYLIKGQNANKDSPLCIQHADKADIAASFQHTAFSNLVEKTLFAAKEYQCRSVVLGGGVSQNHYLRALLEKESSLPIFWPLNNLSLDNAAMIAGLGYHTFLQNGSASMHLEALTRIFFNEKVHAHPTPAPIEPVDTQ
jgi:N6-L-threonylcarbamoyladenine synthase